MEQRRHSAAIDSESSRRHQLPPRENNPSSLQLSEFPDREKKGAFRRGCREDNTLRNSLPETFGGFPRSTKVRRARSNGAAFGSKTALMSIDLHRPDLGIRRRIEESLPVS